MTCPPGSHNGTAEMAGFGDPSEAATIRAVRPDMGTVHPLLERLSSVTRDPVALVLGLVVVGLVPGGLSAVGLPLQRVQLTTAAVAALFFVLAVVRSPANGLVLLYLVPPLFNGEDGRPYFWLLELLVYATVAAGFAVRLG